tara:strand:+ start:102 stop:1253 length:1152 start_codon:yes stop_codon:yes gene_type:complete
MSLLGTTTAEQYYNVSQSFTTTAAQASGGVSQGIYDLTVTRLPSAETDFLIYLNGTEINRSTYSYIATGVNAGRVTIDVSAQPLAVSDAIVIEFIDRSLGDYRFVSLVNIVNNFMYGYTGNGKVLNNVSKTDVLFHARRGVQEFSYEVSRVENIQEVDVPPTLTLPFPQDYVNYVRLSWVDTAGVEHPIFPARYTSRPSESIAQDDQAGYLFDEEGGTLQITPSITQQRFEKFKLDNINGKGSQDDYYLFSHYLSNIYHTSSARPGSDPELNNYNGIFTIDEANGQFGFDSSMSGRTITIKYISDGNSPKLENIKVHKMAEDAMYKYIYHAILSTKLNIPEYQIMRAKKERRAAMRNAKLRLSNVKLHELTQVMRGKSKIIKH